LFISSTSTTTSIIPTVACPIQDVTVFTKNLLTHKPFTDSDFLSCRIQESECKFTGPNKNKNNFTCLLLYQLSILSQKYQAFPYKLFPD
jgi:hypothetical protein